MIKPIESDFLTMETEFCLTSNHFDWGYFMGGDHLLEMGIIWPGFKCKSKLKREIKTVLQNRIIYEWSGQKFTSHFWRSLISGVLISEVLLYTESVWLVSWDIWNSIPVDSSGSLFEFSKILALLNAHMTFLCICFNKYATKLVDFISFSQQQNLNMFYSRFLFKFLSLFLLFWILG